jgi:hypothetical protein
MEFQLQCETARVWLNSILPATGRKRISSRADRTEEGGEWRRGERMTERRRGIERRGRGREAVTVNWGN